MKIYTRTGDNGDTGLIGGQRVSKTSWRVGAIGDIDELNASIGFTNACVEGMNLQDSLLLVQSELFEIGAELASPNEDRFATIQKASEQRLEVEIDQMNLDLPELRNFILPGGSEAAARLHLARAVCRRAERTLLQLHSVEPVRLEIRIYLNRLADWLFVAARWVNYQMEHPDINWKRGE